MKMVGQRAGGNTEAAEPNAAGVDGGDDSDDGEGGDGTAVPPEGTAAAAPTAAAAAKMAKMASRLHASFEVQWATDSERGAGGGGGGAGSGARVAARLRAWLSRVVLPGKRRVLPVDGWRVLPASGGGGTAAAQPTALPRRTPRLVVVYSFRYGIRRLTVTDRLRVQGGAITSMRRTFKL